MCEPGMCHPTTCTCKVAAYASSYPVIIHGQVRPATPGRASRAIMSHLATVDPSSAFVLRMCELVCVNALHTPG